MPLSWVFIIRPIYWQVKYKPPANEDEQKNLEAPGIVDFGGFFHAISPAHIHPGIF